MWNLSDSEVYGRVFRGLSNYPWACMQFSLSFLLWLTLGRESIKICSCIPINYIKFPCWSATTYSSGSSIHWYYIKIWVICWLSQKLVFENNTLLVPVKVCICLGTIWECKIKPKQYDHSYLDVFVRISPDSREVVVSI